MRFGCSVPSVECSVQCAHIDRVGSSAQLPDLILILILNFMPQLRVWLDFLAGNQSAAAAVTALAVALVAALLPSKLRQFDTLETCILAASLATHCAAAPPVVASCLSHSESGDSPQVPPGRAQLSFSYSLSSSSSFPSSPIPVPVSTITISHAVLQYQNRPGPARLATS